MGRLDENVCLIAGAGSGLDAAICQRFARVNARCPVPVRTPLPDKLYRSDPDAWGHRVARRTPKRLAEARALPNTVRFLASDEPSPVKATTLIVDGGASAAYLAPPPQERQLIGGGRE